MRVQLTLDVRGIALEQKGDRRRGQIDVLYVQQSAKAVPSKSLLESITISLSDAEFKNALESGLVRTRDLNIEDAGYYLRVVVRDVSTGSLGSVNIRTENVASSSALTKSKGRSVAGSPLESYGGELFTAGGS